MDPTDGGRTHRCSLSSQWQRDSSATLTEVAAYAVNEGLDRFSDFRYFLDDPVNGDQFEQRVYGFRASHRWLTARAENVVGVQTRMDDIDSVALYHTR